MKQGVAENVVLNFSISGDCKSLPARKEVVHFFQRNI